MKPFAQVLLGVWLMVVAFAQTPLAQTPLAQTPLAQVPAQTEPSKICLEQDQPPPICQGSQVFPWFRFDDLADALGGQDISYHASPARHELLFPDSTSLGLGRIRQPAGLEEYVNAKDLLQGLESTVLEVRLEGWYNPRLWLGQASLVLGTDEAPAEAYGFYLYWLLRITRTLWPGFDGSFFTAYDQRYTLFNNPLYTSKVLNGRPGEVYALLARELAGREAKVFVDVAPVTPEGKVVLYLPKSAVRWVGTAKDWIARNDTVLLLRLSGKAKGYVPEYQMVWPLR
jgi:hypothetical protein